MTVDTEYVPRDYAHITRLDPEWLWDGHIPYGTVTGLFGMEGIAKGFLECMFAAIVTTGKTFPGDKTPVDAGSVIMVTTEDDPNLTMVDRLTAAGADLTKVHDMTEVAGGQFSIPESLPAMREAILAIGDVRLVIIDPLADVASITLSSSVQKVRATLINPLIKLARDTGVAILLTQHTTKDGKKLQGSAAIRQALRMVLKVERRVDNPNLRVISVDKSNIADDSSKSNVTYRLIGERADHSTRVDFMTADSESAEDVVWHDYTDDELKDGWSREAGQSGILRALRESYPRTMRAPDIAAETGTTYIATRVLLTKLKRHGDVTEPSKGDYSVPDRSEVPSDAHG